MSELTDLRQIQVRAKEIDAVPLDLRVAKILYRQNGLKAALQALDDLRRRRPKYCVVVSGSRDWTDASAIRGALERVRAVKWPTFDVIVGDYRGADTLALKIARDELGLTTRKFVANWDQFGLQAGPKRNEAMLATALDEYNAAILLAFPLPDGTSLTRCASGAQRTAVMPSSKGTRHMIQIAKTAHANRWPVMLYVHGEDPQLDASISRPARGGK